MVHLNGSYGHVVRGRIILITIVVAVAVVAVVVVFVVTAAVVVVVDDVAFNGAFHLDHDIFDRRVGVFRIYRFLRFGFGSGWFHHSLTFEDVIGGFHSRVLDIVSFLKMRVNVTFPSILKTANSAFVQSDEFFRSLRVARVRAIRFGWRGRKRQRMRRDGMRNYAGLDGRGRG